MTRPQGEARSSVILDFDGTMVDSFPAAVEVAQVVLKKTFSPDEITGMRGMSAQDVLRQAGVSRLKLPKLALQARQQMASRMDQVQLVDGMDEALRVLHASNDLYIATSNDGQAVRTLLDRYDLSGVFTDISAGIDLLGKANKLRQLMRNHHLVLDRCVYVGDEHRDVEAAQHIGMRCIAVTWGYSTPEALEQLHPDFVIHQPSELSRAVLAA